MNQINRTNQIDQINKTNQIDKINQTRSYGEIRMPSRLVWGVIWVVSLFLLPGTPPTPMPMARPERGRTSVGYRRNSPVRSLLARRRFSYATRRAGDMDGESGLNYSAIAFLLVPGQK